MSQINKPTAPLVTIDPDTKADLINGEVPSKQLPSYVDDVLEFDDSGFFPEEGETGKIYVDLKENTTYRWSGSAYIQLGGGNTPKNTIEFFIPDDWDGDFAELLESQDQELLFNLITDSLDGIAAGLSVPVVCFDQLGNRYEITATGENNADFRIEPNLANKPISDIGDAGGATDALICGSISVELDAETGDTRIDVTINEKTRYATALYVHNLYFYGQVGGSNQWFCLQYKSTSSKRNVEQPTFASELCDLLLNNNNTQYIWHQWHEHDAHLYHATVQINEDPAPSTIKADDELTVLTVLGAMAPGNDELHISFVENGETKNLTVSNIDSQHEVYEMIQPAYIRPLAADNYWPYE